MLTGISSIITPEIYEIIYRMGYHDELAIADANYNARSLSPRTVYSSVARNDGLLEEILKYFPLDDDEPHPVIVMEQDYDPYEPEIWARYKKAISNVTEIEDADLHRIPRADFYARTRTAFACIQTLEPSLCGNIIIRKGVVI